MSVSETVLIVDPEAASRQALLELLKGSRYRTIAADGFPHAVQLLESTRPGLLVTVVRLGHFNGLHLIVRGRALDPRMAALAIDERRDPVREEESYQVGAAYLARPVGAGELLKQVADALAARERRCWSRATVASNVVVRIGNQHARLLDVSDGGFRLESGLLLPPVFRLDFPTIRLAVNAGRVWSRRADAAKVWWSGAELAPHTSESSERWRQLVDTLREQSAAVRWSK